MPANALFEADFQRQDQISSPLSQKLLTNTPGKFSANLHKRLKISKFICRIFKLNKK
jgi:hypothetical protein